MKNRNLCLYVLLGEFIITFVLAKSGFKVQTFAGSAIGVLLWLIPIEILLFQVGKDTTKAATLRGCCKFLFWWLIICYVCIGVLKFFFG